VEESFDPYRKWLGIPPEEQPPHHYRLLGLELFEADPDVIVSAADSRLAFLQTLSKDKRADLAARIAVQIKEAQACLLDPAKKAFYDGQMQRRMAAARKDSPTSPLAMPIVGNTSSQGKWTDSPSSDEYLPNLDVSAATRQTEKRIAGWRTAANYIGLVLLVAFASLSIFLLFKIKSLQQSASPSEIVSANTEVKEHAVVSNPAKSAGVNTPPVQSKHVESNDLPPSQDDSASNSHEVSTERDSGWWPSETSEKISDRMNDESPPKSETADLVPPEDEKIDESYDVSNLERSMARKRIPIPDDDARQAAEKSARDIFGKRIAAVKDIQEKRQLCVQIWQQAVANKNLATKYVLMQMAFQLSCEPDLLQQALYRATILGNVYEVDSWDLRTQAIVKVAKTIQAGQAKGPNAGGESVVLMGRQFAEEAKQAGQIEPAVKTMKAVMPLAKKDQVLMREMNTFNREIERLAARYQPVRKALDTLKEHPDDADANAVAGRWICFECRDWEKGLPMLAKSSDAVLAGLSAKDLLAPKDTGERLSVADDWWEYSQKDKSSYKPGVLSRAEFWYDRALPDLTGPEKTKVESRMRVIVGFDASATPNRGAIETGNIALAKNGTLVEGVANNAEKLLDGDAKNPGWDGSAANSPVPCEWTITFDKVYLLQQIRFHFYDGDPRYYHYTMAYSSDGVNYKPLIDRNSGQSFKWQIIPLNGVPVKSVKLFGTFSHRNRPFSVTEFEAYCIPPKQ
jgi:hypothetical protein